MINQIYAYNKLGRKIALQILLRIDESPVSNSVCYPAHSKNKLYNVKKGIFDTCSMEKDFTDAIRSELNDKILKSYLAIAVEILRKNKVMNLPTIKKLEPCGWSITSLYHVLLVSLFKS